MSDVIAPIAPASYARPTTPTTHADRSSTPTADALWRPAGPVLLACDGTARSDATVRAAHTAASALGVPVRVVAAHEPASALAYVPELLPYDGGFETERRASLRAAVTEELARAASRAVDAASTWPVELVAGDRRSALAGAADAHAAALVVVGAGSHRLLDRILVGELALELLRRVRCPVLSVAPGFAGPAHVAVAGVDGTPASVRAAQAALRLLAPGGRLVLVHAEAWAALADPLPPTFDTATRDQLTAWARDQQAEAGARLARVRALLEHDNPDGATIELRIEADTPAAAILGVAEAVAADLIAVGTHGGGWLNRLVVGSVAQTVMRNTGRSVVASAAPGPEANAALARWAGEPAVATRTTSTAATEWAELLDGFTRRNRGRPTRLVVAGTDGAAYAEQEGMMLAAAVYDRRDRSVDLTFAEPGGLGRRFTHHVPRPERVTLTLDADGVEVGAEVAQARGSTTLTFLAPAAAASAGSAAPDAPATTAGDETRTGPATGAGDGTPPARAATVVPPLLATARVRDELRDRTPRAEAGAHVTITPAPVRSCYLVLEHVSGPRDAVLDYTAFLLSPEGEPPDGAHTRPEFVAVEYDDGDRLSLVLSRALYDGSGPA